VEKFIKHFLFGILCTIVCKALFPYPSGDFSRPEVVNTRETANAGKSDIHTYSPIAYFDAEKHIAFPDITIWENQETEDEDETVEGLVEEASHVRFGATISANASALDLRASAIPLFVLFHSWKHFLS
jgi:hypothetical protein